MFWLPPIAHQDRRWHLPLSEGAAAYLAYRRFVGEDGGRTPWSRKKLSQLLLSDPAFCLWCLWQRHLQLSTRQPATFKSLAQWLNQTPWPQWFPSTEAQAWQSPVAVAAPDRCMKLAARAASAVMSARRRRWAKLSEALIRQLQDADRWFVPGHAGLDVLPIPDDIKQQIAGWRSATERERACRGPLRAKVQRWIRRTWRQPAISYRDLLAAALTAPVLVPQGVVSPDAVKLAALRQLAYGASHEINNPLANISTRAQLLMRLTEEPAMLKHFAAINQQAFRAHEMIADLMLFAKPPQLQYTIVDLADVVRDAVRRTSHEIAEQAKEIQIRERLRSALIQADAVQLTVAVQAVLRNAVDALPDHGVIWVQLTCSAGKRGPKRIKLRIRDNGPGLSAEARQHLFDPFYSGREFGRGLGFGLTKAWTIVRLHQGDISVCTPAKGGLAFTIRLPCD